MNYKFSRYFAFFMVLCLAAWQCTKPTPFGSDLLDDQTADFQGDSIDVTCTIERPDSVVSADRTSSFNYFLCGQIKDPEFGTSSAEIFSLVRPVDTINITAARFDSAYLILPYASAGFYGDTLTAQTLQVFQLTSDIDFNRSYLVSDTLPAGDEIGRLDNLLPKPRTLTKFLDTASSALKLAYIKIPLTAVFGQSLMTIDQAAKLVPSDFHKIFKGIKIKSTVSGSGNGAIMAFNLNTVSSFIRVHYTVGDTAQKKTDYRLSWSTTDQQMSKFVHVDHQYTGTPVATAINQVNPELLYLQGMGGLRLKVAFPADPKLENIIVNKAELQAYGPTSTAFPAIPQLVSYYKDASDNFYFTDDVAYSLQISNGFGLFGGTPVKAATDLVKYQFTLTEYFQSVVKNLADPTKRVIYLDVNISDNLQLLTPSRSIIYGPSHPTYPMKMRIKYTKL